MHYILISDFSSRWFWVSRFVFTLLNMEQSYYIEVMWWAIFMAQNIRFGAGFGPVGCTKKFGLGRKVCYFWGQFFYVFVAKKKLNIDIQFKVIHLKYYKHLKKGAHRSHLGRHKNGLVSGRFYGTEYKIWAGFGPVGCTKKFGLGCKVFYFWGQFFYVFVAKKN